jgi:hypothetical protein
LLVRAEAPTIGFSGGCNLPIECHSQGATHKRGTLAELSWVSVIQRAGNKRQ